MRRPISVEEKIAITLRFLATGESYSSLQYQYRVSQTTISRFVPAVCDAIISCFSQDYIKFPSSESDWLEISKKFEEKWHFPNCFGAMDGKHIAIFHPLKDGSTYYNYKNFHSIVLLALVDADYKFLYVDIGCQGRLSDGAVFRNSSFHTDLINENLKLPPTRSLPVLFEPDSFLEDTCDTPTLPYVFIADDAFPLTTRCMKPYPQRDLSASKRLFNYDVSRGRRTTENTFGIILVNRIRIYSAVKYICAQKQ